MSKKTIIASQMLALAAAGKLAVQSTAVSAEVMDSGTKLGNAAQAEKDPNQVPRMRMDEFCTPLDVCSPPTEDFVKDFDSTDFSGSKFGARRADSGGKTPVADPVQKPQYFASNGIIFAGDINDFGDGGPRPKIDFIISNVPNKPMDMFLLYSDRPFGKKAPGKDGKPTSDAPEDGTTAPMFANPQGSGALGIPLLDATGNLEPNLKFITGIRAEPIKPVPGFDADGNGQFDLSAPLGSLPTQLRTVVLTVNLDKLSDLVTQGKVPQNVFFQVAAFPVGPDGAPAIDFTKALYSDVDQFIIEIPGDNGDMASDPGTKGGAASSSSSGKSGSSSTGSTSAGGKGGSTTTPSTPSTGTGTSTSTGK